MQRTWCPICCTNHDGVAACPGELTPTAGERPGWRITVETARGLEAYAVLIARCEGLWRARVMTYPNVLWKAPGVPGTIKFVGSTGREAMDRAVDFVRRHCLAQGYTMRGDRLLDPPRRDVGKGGIVIPAARKVRFLPLRFGVVQASEAGGTGNLSESGLYIITHAPLAPGDEVKMSIQVAPTRPIALEGHVIWMTKTPRVGTPPGMGVSLSEPPTSYVRFVRGLP
jgi:hypothetical protein